MLDFIFDTSLYLPSEAQKHYFEHKTVLITGAAGSIGSALTKALSIYNCKLILVDHTEYALFKLQQDLNNYSSHFFYLGDITDERIVQHLFESFQPDIVYHIAAYKHVALTQAHPYAVFRTNTLASELIAKHAALNNTEHCILVSTDKAVNPINVLGQSKYLAEEIFKHYNKLNQITNFKVIRFGNIPYSTGSILPLFEFQLIQNKKIEIRNKEVARYFINMKDVVRHLGNLPQYKNELLFIPSMGTPIKIIEVTKALISRLQPDKNPEDFIKYTVLIQGEKLSEELTTSEEQIIDSIEDLGLYSSSKNLELQNIMDFITQITPKTSTEELNTLFSKIAESKIKAD